MSRKIPVFRLINLRSVKVDEVTEGESRTVKGGDGKNHLGSVRIKKVRCGKPRCKGCPHEIYVYIRYRDGKHVREKYLGSIK